jgi:hypothetical protein
MSSLGTPDSLRRISELAFVLYRVSNLEFSAHPYISPLRGHESRRAGVDDFKEVRGEHILRGRLYSTRKQHLQVPNDSRSSYALACER